MRMVVTISMILVGADALRAEEIKLPPEVTPALRAACEADVRRLCVTPTSTVTQVRTCVLMNFLNLGQRCRREITLAGLAPQ